MYPSSSQNILHKLIPTGIIEFAETRIGWLKYREEDEEPKPEAYAEL
jgi:hypothetical protein